MGLAAPRNSLDAGQWTARAFLRPLRRSDLRLGVSAAQHGVVLVRRPRRRAPAGVEHDRLRPLPSFDLQRLHPVLAELDHPVRLRDVLPERAAARAHRVPQLRAARAGSRSGVLGAGTFRLEPGGAPLLLHWLVNAPKTVAVQGRPLEIERRATRETHAWRTWSCELSHA